MDPPHSTAAHRPMPSTCSVHHARSPPGAHLSVFQPDLSVIGPPPCWTCSSTWSVARSLLPKHSSRLVNWPCSLLPASRMSPSSVPVTSCSIVTSRCPSTAPTWAPKQASRRSPCRMWSRSGSSERCPSVPSSLSPATLMPMPSPRSSIALCHRGRAPPRRSSSNRTRTPARITTRPSRATRRTSSSHTMRPPKGQWMSHSSASSPPCSPAVPPAASSRKCASVVASATPSPPPTPPRRTSVASAAMSAPPRESPAVHRCHARRALQAHGRRQRRA